MLANSATRFSKSSEPQYHIIQYNESKQTARKQRYMGGVQPDNIPNEDLKRTRGHIRKTRHPRAI